MNARMQSSPALQVTVAGLATAGLGILVQVASGSTLYPSVVAPVALLGSAALVALGPRRWAPFVGFGVAILLGLGAIVGVAINGGVLGQITKAEHIGLVVGSLLHAVGLIAAGFGAVAMLRSRATA